MTERKNTLKKEEKREKAVLESGTYEAIEREFMNVIQDLMGERGMDKFRNEYEKLFEALKKGHDNEKLLIAKCQELNSHIHANADKVYAAMKLSQDDQTLIDNLKKEVEKAWALVEAARAKETLARKTAIGMKQEVAVLAKLVEQGNTLTGEKGITELLKVKQDLMAQLEEKEGEVESLHYRIAELEADQEEMKVKYEEQQQQINKYEVTIHTKDNDAQRALRSREKLEKDLKITKVDLEVKGAELRNIKTQVEKYQTDIGKLETANKEIKVTSEKYLREAADILDKFKKMQNELSAQEGVVTSLMADNQAKSTEIKMREEDLNAMRNDISRLAKLRDGMARKLASVEEQKIAFRTQRDLLKTQIAKCQKEVEGMTKEAQLGRRAMDDLKKDKDNMQREMMKAYEMADQREGVILLHERTIVDLTRDVKDYREEATKHQKLVIDLERIRNEQVEKASKLYNKIGHLKDDQKILELQLVDYKKRELDAESKMKDLQTQYESVRNDRNVFSKSLIEAKDEIRDGKKRMEMVIHQVDQLKEEVSYKDACVIKEHLDNQRLEKEKETLQVDSKRLRDQISELRFELDNQKDNEGTLRRRIAAIEGEVDYLKKEHDKVVGERDILGTQLLRRNDELSLLYEKIKIQQATLNKGEMQFNQRVEDIRILKKEIRQLRCKKTMLERGLLSLEDMRRDLYRQHRELLQVRTRCRALEEELENPLNIHRWRRLEGNDPSLYEMILKMQLIQKRLIFKTEEVAEKELALKEKEQLYVELKRIMARQPGLETAEQLAAAQKVIRKKRDQMKMMKSEVKMHESQVSYFKYDIEQLTDELKKTKQKNFRLRHSNQANKNLSNNRLPAFKPHPPLHLPQFVGGGFLTSQGRPT